MQRSSRASDPPSRLITFRAAEDWTLRTRAPLGRYHDMAVTERPKYDELAELAVMSALGAWIRRWQPMAIHGAMLAGARPEAIVGALGNDLQVAFDRWHEWAVERDLIIGDKPGITAEEYETVARRFAGIGIKPPAKK